MDTDSYFAGDLAWSIIKGPLEALVGVAYGVIVGFIIWYIPSRASVSIYRGYSNFFVEYGFYFTE